MLFAKRLFTALVAFGILFVVLRTGALMVGGGIMGARASAEAQQQRGANAAQSFQEGLAIGAQAGLKFREDYGQNIGLAALGVATLGALWLAFGGVLPWCRNSRPPPMPTNHYSSH